MNTAIEAFWIVLGGTLGLCAVVVMLSLFYTLLAVALRAAGRKRQKPAVDSDQLFGRSIGKVRKHREL